MRAGYSAMAKASYPLQAARARLAMFQGGYGPGGRRGAVSSRNTAGVILPGGGPPDAPRDYDSSGGVSEMDGLGRSAPAADQQNHVQQRLCTWMRPL